MKYQLKIDFDIEDLEHPLNRKEVLDALLSKDRRKAFRKLIRKEGEIFVFNPRERMKRKP